MAKMTLGIFSDKQEAEAAIGELESRGYNPKDISIVMKDKEEAHEVADNTGSSAAEGAVSGAATGGALGALAGLLIGIGAIAIPGIGGILIGGPIAAALGLSGAAATTVAGATTGAVAGGLLGALVNLGVSEDDAKIYEERVRSGGILLAVPARDGSADEAANILQESGADTVRTINTKE